MQDKSQNLLPGQSLPDGALQFDCRLGARRTDNPQAPDWRGVYVHGTPGERFLYLSLSYKEADQWIRRIKIQLSSITWPLIESAAQNQGILEATINGARSGTVPLLGEGWVIR